VSADATRNDDAVRRAPLTLPEAIVLLTDPPARSRRTSPASPQEQKQLVDPAPVPNELAARSHTTPASRRPGVVPPAPLPGPDRSAAANNQARINPVPVKTIVTPPVGPARIAERRNQAARDRHEAPADVHIHIGRIELTAVTAQAPPRRQPAVKAAMPLDEYLQRRNGRAR
jgi:hypothetical protein